MELKLIYHETSMKIPLSNALFDGKLNIEKYYKEKKPLNLENLFFKKVDKKIFPAVTLIDKMNQFSSAPIIINAANEILVDHFLKKKIEFLDINKIIMAILKDGNFKKYAVKKPRNIKQIYQIDSWAKLLTRKKLKKI